MHSYILQNISFFFAKNIFYKNKFYISQQERV